MAIMDKTFLNKTLYLESDIKKENWKYSRGRYGRLSSILCNISILPNLLKKSTLNRKILFNQN